MRRPALGGDRLEVMLGRLLRAGVAASSLCLAAGLAMVFAGAAGALSRALLATGVVLLIATPAARVAAASVGYALRREWIFVGLTLVVFAELVGSLVAAIHGGRR
jgi:uncharacterized membrane protein